MALLFLDGFDDNGTTEFIPTTAQSAAGLSYCWASTSLTFDTTIYRTAQTAPVVGRSLRLQAASVTLASQAPLTTVYVGFAWYTAGPGLDLYGFNQTTHVFDFAENPYNLFYMGAGKGLDLTYNSKGQFVAAKANGGTVLGTSTNSFPLHTWHSIEMKYVFGSGTSGSFELKVNGNSEINVTSVDTAGGAAAIMGLMIGSGADNNCPMYYDDFYVCDSTGTVNNNYLGDISVYTLLPTANSSVAMTASTGSNFSCVNTVPIGANYVAATAANQTDLYTMTQIPTTGLSSIPGVLVKAITKKTTGAVAKVSLATNYSATTSLSTALTVPVSANPLSENAIFETDPTGAAWNSTSVNGVTVGVKSV